MGTRVVKVPQVGESITEVVMGAWRKSPGQAVAADEPLVEVESDKATMEIPSPAAGVLLRITRQKGETAAVGETIAEIDEGATASAGGAPAPAPAPAASVAVANGAPPITGAPPVKASPSVRRLMAEHDLHAVDVAPTGPAGRIERGDVLRTLASESTPAAAGPGNPAAPAVVNGDPSPPARRQGVGGPRDRVDRTRAVPMTPLRKTVARRLLEAQRNAAILTTFNEVNMLGVMSLREKYKDAFVARHGIKLGFMSFFVKAAVEALKAFPSVNAEVDGDTILYKDYYDLGVAVGGGKGLVVPVVRDCDRLSLAEIEKAIAALAAKAKDNKLSLPELQGGTFTISNGGVYGSMMSTPILNPPQSGILGLHKIDKRAVVENDQIVIRPMMYVALSYDHRIIDGREAVQFLVRIKECIEDPERLLIEV